ncbi:MAG: hypothetical protein V4591_08805 [Bdellovibrionota bacterium]
MLESLLELITLEKLLFFFKEQSFVALTVKPRGDMVVMRSDNIFQISDSELLKQILPKEISQKMFGTGNLNLLAFVFALRHKITLLNILFHVSSLEEECQQSYLENLDSVLSFKVSTLFYEYKHMLQADFWGNSGCFPVVGFSAVGCLFSFQSVGLCRAFDHYDIVQCKNKIENIFCVDHKYEIFWESSVSKDASTQAKMFHFYLEKNNFSEYDEISLQKLLNDFYKKYENYKISFSEEIKTILAFYQFINVDELKLLGLEELRKRFLAKAKQLHPDVGGSQDLFREARTNYEQLKELL